MSAVLSDFVLIRGRYHRSVNLSADWDDRSSLGEFIPTRSIALLAERIASQAVRPAGVRTWSLTGPYGAGKSAFALFLADILANRRPRHAESRRIRDSLSLGEKEFLPILLTAQRGPLEEGLRAALANARRELGATTRGRPQSELASVLIGTAEVAKKRRKAGLLIVVDELGKFLEFAALRPNEADVFLLQKLAETAARSGIPVVLVTILHSGFSDY